MTDPDDHRPFMERRWPGLAVETFDPLPGGWDCFTYLVNGEWVFQLPRLPGSEERLRKQLVLLPELAREVSSAVPVPEYTSTDPICMGYRRIEGEPMSADVDGIWPERLGRFLYDLHLTPPEFVGMRALSAALVRRALRHEVDALGHVVLPVRDLPHARRHRPRARAGDRTWILHAMPGVGERGLGAYGGPPGDRFLGRAAFSFMLMPWHEVMHGAETGQPGFVQSGLAGVREWLR